MTPKPIHPTGTSSYKCGWRLFSRTWNTRTSPWIKQRCGSESTTLESMVYVLRYATLSGAWL